ncbi:TetR/AcrR family transcriptional regulator [Sphingomonas sp. So64.6b]|uniref:TetR/AcrR family transcriptional regulator n=1 Tax=Sphingomonas sp. So64.6b TaxID=2997354 RepID=UPI001600AA35|nr:TetR/AcrR family transcriptional regulator [Sphingomonas sp. So64.6b]QNA82816.1 TetR/AcrR family transcriptional regulator [Sphingomonas sp. So64.6b]
MSETTVENLGRTESKRRTILDAATTLFLRQGFLGTSMDEVASLASVSKQTVYKQFASKEALFVGIVQSLTGHASDRVQTGMEDPADAAEMADELRGHADRLLTIALTPQLLQLRRLVIGEAMRFPELGKALYEGGPGRAISGLATVLERWAQRGLLTVDDPLVAATQFNWLIMGEPVNRAMFYGDEGASMTSAKRDAHVGAAIRVFLAAYEPGRSRS